MVEPVTLVIPHYSDLVRLDALLATLSIQSYPREHVEIIVVDNNSPCGREAVIACVSGRANVIICHERGAGPARNAGVAAASHALLAFIDSDCLAHPDWLANGIAALQDAQRGSVDLVGGRMEVAVRQPSQRSGAEAFEQVFAFDNRSYVMKQNFSVTANLFTRRDVFDRIGGFRTQVSEDLEWCQRAGRAGFGLTYADNAIVTHPARANWAELIGKWRRLQNESFALALERPGGRWRWLARAWLLPPSILAHAPAIFHATSLDNNGERWRALGTLMRLRMWRFVDAHWLAFNLRRFSG